MSGNRQFKFEYTGIRVKDMDESISFYTDVLGMKLVGRGSTEATKGVWAQLKSEGSKHLLELNWCMRPTVHSTASIAAEKNWTIYVFHLISQKEG